MSEEKFNVTYFETNYHIADYHQYKNVVFRNEDSSGCSSKDKCLKACIAHFIKENLINVKKISEHFTKSDHTFRDGIITRCCCSQKENDGITHGIVTHNQSNMSFIVGSVCFLKQFEDAEDAKTFWKEECKYCGLIVKKKNKDRPYFCNLKCVKKHREEEEMKEHELRLKKWEEQEHQQSKNKNPVYTQCQKCNIPKTCAEHQKWLLCYKCNKKKKSLNNRF